MTMEDEDEDDERFANFLLRMALRSAPCRP
jgi:hypothetical protein